VKVDGPVALFGADVAGDERAFHCEGMMLSLLGTAPAPTLRKWFSSLAKAGRVVEDLQMRPWGACDGQVIDRYGLHWLIGFEEEDGVYPQRGVGTMAGVDKVLSPMLGPARQRSAIEWLAAWCSTRADVSSLSVGCSIGRGVADELSDIDAAVGVLAPPGRRGRDVIERVENALVASFGEAGDVVDVLRDGSTSHEFVIRRVFVQYADRLQLDLAVIAEEDVRRGDAAPDFITVYRADTAPRPVDAQRSAYAVSAEQVHEWVFRGWRALLDADKYLQRGSLWEAHSRLHEARGFIWQVWAAAKGTSYPQHGLPQVLDDSPDDLPPGIEDTVAGLNAAELRHSLMAASRVLTQCTNACAPRLGTEPPIAAYARTVLHHPERVEGSPPRPR
jgi:hypothetical protein